MARARVEERDRALGAPARGRIDELDAVDLEAEQRLGEVRDLEADVVEALALALQEARDAGRVVGRLDELDLRLPHPEERDPHVVLRDVHDVSSSSASASRQRPSDVLDRAHDERDVVDPADPADGLRETRAVGGVRRHPGSVPCRP